MVTADELDALVENGGVKYYDTEDVFESWDELKDGLDNEGVQTPLGRLFKEAEFGGMDQGSEYWVVVGVENNGIVQLFKKDGWYASHVGSELDGPLYEVESYEKVVTNYRPLTGR